MFLIDSLGVDVVIHYWLLTEKEERIQREKEQGTYKEKVSEKQD